MQALYRKYRPTRLQDVIGQEQITKPLENAIRQGKFSHAYLFIGPRGCGKTSVARIFAHQVNQFDYQIEDSYTDIIEIDAASNTGVDNIRELREKAAIAPSQGKYKVYIIDEVHMLSKSAFNALLKTLEEPPRHVIFIMATTDAYKIPPTITSRAQVYNFSLAAPDVMKSHLESIAKQEKIKITPDALDIIISRGGGSFRDSLSLLDQISTLGGNSSGSGEITREAVISALGLPDEDIIDQLLTAYKQGNADEITDLLKSTINSGTKPEILAENLINSIIKHPEPLLLPLLGNLPNVRNPFPEAKLLLAFLGKAALEPKFGPFGTNRPVEAPAGKTTPSAPVASPTPVTSADAANAAPKNTVVDSTSVADIQPAPISAPATSQTTPVIPPDQSTVAPAITIDFDYFTFKSAIAAANTVISKSLDRAEHSLDGNTLYLYAPRGFDRKILEAPNNFKLLKAALPANITLEITDDARHIKKSPQVAQISDIMDGEVQEVNISGNPFK